MHACSCFVSSQFSHSYCHCSRFVCFGRRKKKKRLIWGRNGKYIQRGRIEKNCTSRNYLVNKIQKLCINHMPKQVGEAQLIFCFILLTHEGSQREVYQEFQLSYDIFCRRCQGLFRPQVPCTPSLHCPIANSASTQSQQPV